MLESKCIYTVLFPGSPAISIQLQQLNKEKEDLHDTSSMSRSIEEIITMIGMWFRTCLGSACFPGRVIYFQRGFVGEGEGGGVSIERQTNAVKTNKEFKNAFQ